MGLFLRLVVVLVFIFSTSTTALAVSPSSILVEIIPNNPAPNEEVRLNLSSYVSNLNTVTIEWFINGKKVNSGIGVKTLSTTAGEEGSKTTIIAKIMLPDGEINKQIVLAPSAMTLLWQANDSYTPPFYKGKAFPTIESEIKVVAMPESKGTGGTSNSKNLAYEWQRNYENELSASGYGKNYFTFVSDYFDNSNTISVSASSIDQSYSSRAETTITTVSPKLVFYPSNKDLGIAWWQAITDGYKVTGEEVVVAAPYFISPADINIPLLNWNWSINGNRVGITTVAENMLPIKAQPGTSGRSKIRLDITSNYKIFQNVGKEINVEF